MRRFLRGVLAATLLAVAAVPAVAQPKEQILFAEPFDGRLAAGWSWVRENPKAWRIDKGTLLLQTSPGSLWQKQNNNHNLLLRTPPPAKEGPFAVEVLVENDPTGGFEHAGLVWYYDDDNYAILVKEKLGPKHMVQLVTENKGRPKVGFAEKPYVGKTVWLRLEVAGGKLRGQYRATAKEAWQTLGQCDFPGTGAARVGLITGYGPKNGERLSRFRSFRIVRVAK